MSQEKQSVWRDITTDYETGHTVFKDWSKAVAFGAGLVYMFLLVPAVILLTAWLRPEHDPIVLPVEIGFGLLGTGVTTQVIKEFSGYFSRKTKDADGALTVPGTQPAPLMPQADSTGGATG